MLDSLQIKLVMDELKFQRRFLSGLQSETLVVKNVFVFFYSSKTKKEIKSIYTGKQITCKSIFKGRKIRKKTDKNI
jgi:hypothetical protein